jgi:beta-galactosidase
MQWTDVPWQSGVIKAVGMKDGKEVAVDSIKTVGAPAKIMLKPDRTTLYADGDDVSCIEVDIGDADNNSICTADNGGAVYRDRPREKSGHRQWRLDE